MQCNGKQVKHGKSQQWNPLTWTVQCVAASSGAITGEAQSFYMMHLHLVNAILSLSQHIINIQGTVLKLICFVDERCIFFTK